MYCGIDVSKNKSRVCLLDDNQRVINEFGIEHTKEGFEKFKSLVPKNTKIILEVTGNYSKVLYNYLCDKYDVIYIDNVQMNHIARYHSPILKNDKIDAMLLAKALSFPGLLKVNPIRTNELKDLCNLYLKIRKQLIQYKLIFKDQINIVFPEIESLMNSNDNLGIAKLLLLYSTPNEIASLEPKTILSVMKSDLGKGSANFKLEKAIKIKELAMNSIGDSNYPTTYFKYSIETMLYSLSLRKKIHKELETALQNTNYFSLIKKFGFDVVSVSIIVGEIGDVRRFSNYKKFVSYCGFGIYEKRSGTSVNKSSRLSKRGNKLLRATFYTLVLVHLSKKTSIYNYYERLKNRGKHPKKCLIAAARKIAIQTYYDMIKCHEEYKDVPNVIFKRSEYGLK